MPDEQQAGSNQRACAAPAPGQLMQDHNSLIADRLDPCCITFAALFAPLHLHSSCASSSPAMYQ